MMVAAVAFDDAPTSGPRQKAHELGEQGLAGVSPCVQVDTTRKRAKNRTDHWFQNFNPILNRTVVRCDHD